MIVLILLVSCCSIAFGQTPTLNWTTLRILSAARDSFASTNYQDLAFFAGGYIALESYTNAVDIINTTTGTRITRRLGLARHWLAAASVGTQVIFAGGKVGPSHYTNHVDIYDVAQDTMTNSTLSVVRGGLVATTIGSKALFAGGFNNVTHLTTVDMFDSYTQTWTRTNLQFARDNLAACSVGPHALFGGGYGGNASVSKLEIFSVLTHSWLTPLDMPLADKLACTTVLSRVLFAGGVGLSNVVYMYDFLTHTVTSPGLLSRGREFLAGATIGRAGLFAGGQAENNMLMNNVDYYNFTTNTIVSGTPLRVRRAQLRGASTHNAAVFASGLFNQTAPPYYYDGVEIVTGCNCAQGSEPTDNCTCVACPPHCQRCVNGICYFCDRQYYLSANKTCTSCPAGCAWCASASVCGQCVLGYSLSGSLCDLVTCPNNSAGLPCTCSSNSFGAVSWNYSASSWAGSCTACMSGCTLCTNTSSCEQCEFGYDYANSLCISATCPSHSTGAPSCVCDFGYSGVLQWDSTASVWLGNCSAVPCPANAAANASGARCMCNRGYSGAPQWNSTTSTWDGACPVVSCHSGAMGAPACGCNGTDVGRVDWDASNANWTGYCAACSCSPLAICLAHDGGAHCLCNAGYYSNGLQCDVLIEEGHKLAGSFELRGDWTDAVSRFVLQEWLNSTAQLPCDMVCDRKNATNRTLVSFRVLSSEKSAFEDLSFTILTAVVATFGSQYVDKTYAAQLVTPPSGGSSEGREDILGFLILGGSLAFFLFLLALEMVASKRGRPSRALFKSLLTLADFISDCRFSYSLATGEFPRIYYISIIFILLPILVNCVFLCYTVYREIKTNQAFADLLARRTSVVAVLMLLACLDTEHLLLLEGDVYLISSPLLSKQSIWRLRSGGMIVTIFEDIPQLAIQTFVALASKFNATSAYVALPFTAISVIFSLSKKALICCYAQTHGSKAVALPEGEIYHRESHAASVGDPHHRESHAASIVSRNDVELQEPPASASASASAAF